MSKCRKRPWNLYKYKNSLLKTYFSLIIEYGLYLKCLQKPRCLVGSKQAKRSDPPCRKQRWIPPSICVFCRRIFNLEMQNFSLENHHMMNARQPFCWWMTFTKVSNPFLPSPPKWLTWPLDVCGMVEWGMGDFTDLVWEFFPKPLWS